jgi:hypothetical protein
MNALYLIGAGVTLLLFAYLGWALVRAEDF